MAFVLTLSDEETDKLADLAKGLGVSRHQAVVMLVKVSGNAAVRDAVATQLRRDLKGQS